MFRTSVVRQLSGIQRRIQFTRCFSTVDAKPAPQKMRGPKAKSASPKTTSPIRIVPPKDASIPNAPKKIVPKKDASIPNAPKKIVPPKDASIPNAPKKIVPPKDASIPNAPKKITSPIEAKATVTPDMVTVAMNTSDDMALNDTASCKVDGSPFIFSAISGCNVTIVKKLVDAKADVNALDKHGYSILCRLPNSQYSVQIADALIKAGADLTRGKVNSLMAAIRCDLNLRLIEFLLHAHITAGTVDFGCLPYFLQYAGGNPIKLASMLLDAKADVNMANSHGTTVLMSAVKLTTSSRQRNVGFLLHRAKADVNCVDAASRTALMYAARGGCGRYVTALLKAKADPGMLDCHGQSAASIALMHGRESIAMQILDCCKDPKAPVEVNKK